MNRRFIYHINFIHHISISLVIDISFIAYNTAKKQNINRISNFPKSTPYVQDDPKVANCDGFSKIESDMLGIHWIYLEYCFNVFCLRIIRIL